MYGPNAQKAFGAVQMIFVGDLYQLPPVVSNEEREIFRTHYATLYFLQRQRVPVLELETVYRQQDAQFVSLWHKIRNNSAESKDMEEPSVIRAARTSNPSDYRQCRGGSNQYRHLMGNSTATKPSWKAILAKNICAFG